MAVLTINLIFLALNLLMAWYHGRLIKANKPIKHGLWAAGYLVAVCAACLFFTWWYLPALIFLRAVVFSPALSLFRKLPINYISTSTTAIIDKLEYRLFERNWYARMGCYLVLLVVSEIVLICKT